MSTDVHQVLADLQAEQAALEVVLTALGDGAWSTPTASPRWTVADQVGHLAYFDRTAALAISDPDAFTAAAAELGSQMTGEADSMDRLTLGPYRTMEPSELLADWRANRDLLSSTAAVLENETRVVWYGPSMGSKSFLTARLMECWAHGQDVVDAVGGAREATDRLRHIAQLGFITRGWTYKNRGLEVPSEPVRVGLTAPSGAVWTFGPDDATESVVGSALDFCLVVTQRRNVTDTNLVVSPVALDWLQMSQAFAGAATDPPKPHSQLG